MTSPLGDSFRTAIESALDRKHVRVLDGDDIADDVARRVMTRIVPRTDSAGTHLEEIVHETIYAERSRLARCEDDPRTAADREFLTWLRRELAHSDSRRPQELIAKIVERYVGEISGHFDIRVYRMATQVVPLTLSVLLHGLRGGEGLLDPTLFDVEDRIVVDGEIETLRALVEIGTVVLAPTHVSNLDSVVLGSAIHEQGLPPFAYGAGLNLFSNRVIGFFMRNLGAYTVDRRKSDPLYRETLKEYVTVLLEEGQHNLFFPGGTRSRSGALETHLKLGLLGTVPTAYRRAFGAGKPRSKVFVVPCTLSYPLVLEAATLIEDYLRAEGGAHYVDVRDEFDRPRRWLEFFRGLMKLDQRVHVTVGHPFDVVGNDVDRYGVSRDPRGRIVDPSGYFLVDGRLQADAARDAAYTRLLASRLLCAYKQDSLVLATSLTAFVVLALLRRERREPDLFRFLRSIAPEPFVATDAVLAELDRALEELRARAAASEIRLDDAVERGSTITVLERALATFGTYHPAPVIEQRGGRIVVRDVNLLYYYRNRLSGYGLLGEPELVQPVLRSAPGWPT